MEKIFLLINIVWKKTPMTIENVEKVETALGNFGDWFRFNGTTWFLYTDLNEHVLYGALSTVLTREDYFIVTRFDPATYAGWGPGNVDDWVRNRQLKLIQPPS
ncbi:MAG: hypothetical protein JWQ02_3933 [Capsulimonas sp.]|nr:hypothetical protein [Capsulimonas sp.]